MTLKVHPGIGVARIGDSPTDWALAPETIEIDPPPTGGYRDASCRLKRLGARFRVFEYLPGSTDPVELVATADTTIVWSVKLGSVSNGATGVLGESNTETISGPNQVKVFDFVTVTVPYTFDVCFAELRTDSQGRLIVLSSPQLDYPAFQGHCDGWVSATVWREGVPEDAVVSWVHITAPDFAPGRRPTISFYDLLYQRHGLAAPALPSFRKDIFPILRARNAGRPLASSIEANFPLLSGAAERETVAGIDPDMPPAGETGSDVTAVQFAILAKWISGSPGVDFENDWPPPATLPDPIPRVPAELDRGPLSHCISFGAGTWESSGVPSAATLPTLYAEPFRLMATAPFGTMVPSAGWQDDLGVCVGISNWVPQVESVPILAGGTWSSRGFMVLQNDDLEYVETCTDPYVLLITPALEFGEVPQGPGAAGASAHLPIVFEVVAGADDVELVLTAPLPPFFANRGLSETVPAGETRTVKLWITYATGAVGDSSHAVLSVAGPAGAVYEVLVHAATGAYEPTQLALVLDCSTSMNADRGDGLSKLLGLIDAAKAIVALGREEDALGMARFSSDVIAPSFPVTPFGTDRTPMNLYLDGLSTVASTSIGDGLIEGNALLAADVSGTYTHGALIVVTDGKENAPEYVDSVAATLTANTFAIGIGMPDDVDVSMLQVLTGNLGGYLLLTGDPVAGGNYFTLEKYLLQVLAGALHDEVVVDPEGVVVPGAVERVVFPVTEADLGFDAVVFSREPERLALALQAPNGELLPASAVLALQPGSFVSRPQVSYFRIRLPLVGSRGAPLPPGEWQLLLAARSPEQQHDTAPFLAPKREGKPLPYCAAITARSALKLGVDSRQREPLPGSPILVEAVLTAFGGPWSRARVSAELRGPGGMLFDVPLVETEPGRFTGSYTPVRPGLYRLRVRADGKTPRNLRFRREVTLTAGVVPSGSLSSNGSQSACRPPRPPAEGPNQSPEGHCARAAERLAAGLVRLAEKLRKHC